MDKCQKGVVASLGELQIIKYHLMSHLSHIFVKGYIFHSYRLKDIKIDRIGIKKHSCVMNWRCVRPTASDNTIPVLDFIDVLDCHILFAAPKERFNVVEWVNDENGVQIYAVAEDRN